MHKFNIDKIRKKAILKYRFVYKHNKYRIQERRLFWHDVMISDTHIGMPEALLEFRKTYFDYLCQKKYGTIKFEF